MERNNGLAMAGENVEVIRRTIQANRSDDGRGLPVVATRMRCVVLRC